MSIWIRYTEHKFVKPKQISLTDFNQLKGDYKNFISNITAVDKDLFFSNYKFKIFIGPIILLLCLLIWERIVEIGRDWIVVIYIILSIIGIKCFGYILSSLSIWDNIQNKKRHYKKVKELADKSFDYNDFQKKLLAWNKRQDLGLTGQLTYKILMSLRGKSR